MTVLVREEDSVCEREQQCVWESLKQKGVEILGSWLVAGDKLIA